MGSEKKFDLVILGSGSTAFAAALRAQELGKTALMTEERTVGGTCVNRGCLPSKNLIEAAKLLYDAQRRRNCLLGCQFVQGHDGLHHCFHACTGQNDCKGRGYLNVPAEGVSGLGRCPVEEVRGRPGQERLMITRSDTLGRTAVRRSSAFGLGLRPPFYAEAAAELALPGG